LDLIEEQKTPQKSPKPPTDEINLPISYKYGILSPYLKYYQLQRESMLKRFIAFFIIVSFILSYYQPVYAQNFSINQLPVPGTMVGESVPFAPLILKGIVINLQKPLEFQFIVDTGHGSLDSASVKTEANQLVKYFLAGLTIPEDDLWVNLSPYEKNRMVPEALGQTDLGRDLLAQDYILKQLTASLIYPEKALGKEFWSRIYAKAQQQFGTTNVPVNTFNKVWILPDQAQVFEHGAAAYVTKATLKVMLDEDYLALKKHTARYNGTDLIGANIVRQIVIPEITEEVNTGKNFAPLRQIYQALILAKWYKETIQNGLLDAVYTNKNKVAGVNLTDPAIKEQIYERYLKAYKKGAFNYIKEDPMPDGQVVPRKYFSGGEVMIIPLKENGTEQDVENQKPDGAMISLTVKLLLAAGITVAAIPVVSTVRAKYRNWKIKKELTKNWGVIPFQRAPLLTANKDLEMKIISSDKMPSRMKIKIPKGAEVLIGISVQNISMNESGVLQLGKRSTESGVLHIGNDGDFYSLYYVQDGRRHEVPIPKDQSVEVAGLVISLKGNVIILEKKQEVNKQVSERTDLDAGMISKLKLDKNATVEVIAQKLTVIKSARRDEIALKIKQTIDQKGTALTWKDLIDVTKLRESQLTGVFELSVPRSTIRISRRALLVGGAATLGALALGWFSISRPSYHFIEDLHISTGTYNKINKFNEEVVNNPSLDRKYKVYLEAVFKNDGNLILPEIQYYEWLKKQITQGRKIPAIAIEATPQELSEGQARTKESIDLINKIFPRIWPDSYQDKIYKMSIFLNGPEFFLVNEGILPINKIAPIDNEKYKSSILQGIALRDRFIQEEFPKEEKAVNSLNNLINSTMYNFRLPDQQEIEVAVNAFSSSNRTEVQKNISILIRGQQKILQLLIERGQIFAANCIKLPKGSIIHVGKNDVKTMDEVFVQKGIRATKGTNSNPDGAMKTLDNNIQEEWINILKQRSRLQEELFDQYLICSWVLAHQDRVGFLLQAEVQGYIDEYHEPSGTLLHYKNLLMAWTAKYGNVQLVRDTAKIFVQGLGAGRISPIDAKEILQVFTQQENPNLFEKAVDTIVSTQEFERTPADESFVGLLGMLDIPPIFREGLQKMKSQFVYKKGVNNLTILKALTFIEHSKIPKFRPFVKNSRKTLKQFFLAIDLSKQEKSPHDLIFWLDLDYSILRNRQAFGDELVQLANENYENIKINLVHNQIILDTDRQTIGVLKKLIDLSLADEAMIVEIRNSLADIISKHHLNKIPSDLIRMYADFRFEDSDVIANEALEHNSWVKEVGDVLRENLWTHQMTYSGLQSLAEQVGKLGLKSYKLFANWQEIPGVPLFSYKRLNGDRITITVGDERLPNPNELHFKNNEEIYSKYPKLKIIPPFTQVIKNKRDSVNFIWRSEFKGIAINDLRKIKAYCQKPDGIIKEVDLNKQERNFLGNLYNFLTEPNGLRSLDAWFDKNLLKNMNLFFDIQNHRMLIISPHVPHTLHSGVIATLSYIPDGKQGWLLSASYMGDVSIGDMPVAAPDAAMNVIANAPIMSEQGILSKGGIDLNQINVNRTGKAINVQFDSAQLNALEQGDFKGFTPEITGFRYIQSPFPLLGINNPAK